jgi:hypothetical protein
LGSASSSNLEHVVEFLWKLFLTNVVRLEIFEGQVASSVDVLGIMEDIPKLGRQVKLLSLDKPVVDRFGNCVSDFIFVAVNPRGIDVSVTELNSGQNSGFNIALWREPSSKAELRHDGAIVKVSARDNGEFRNHFSRITDFLISEWQPLLEM